MRNIRSLAAGTLLVGLVAGQASAQGADIRNLGRQATLGATCLVGAFGTNCTQAQITLTLDGLDPFDNQGQAVPAAVMAYDQDRFRQGTFQFGLGSNITGVSGLPAGYTSLLDPAGGFVVVSDAQIPLTNSSFSFIANLSGGTATSLSVSGISYLDANLQYVNAAGVPLGIDVVPTAGGPFYRTADFNETIALSAVPEPSTYVLMASGLLAIAGVARRRRTD